MAITRDYRLHSTLEEGTWLELRDNKLDNPPSIEIAIAHGEGREEAYERLSMPITLDEAHELRSALAEILGIDEEY